MTGGLERLLCPEEPLRVTAGTPDGAATWLRADGWRVYARPAPDAGSEEIARFTLADGSVRSARLAGDVARLPFDVDEAYVNFVSERWREGVRQTRLTERQLGLFYRVKRLIPRGVQLAARRLLARRQSAAEFPAWPLEESLLHLVRFAVRCSLLAAGTDELRFRWFWPDGHAAALALTHDVESAEGLRLAVAVADAEEARGLRSSFNVVVADYPVDEGILRELRSRGFEVGLHGVRHDRSLFSSRESFEAQLPVLREAAERFGAVGFRSPATHRVFEWLGDLPVEYDSSIPHSDPYEPQPGGSCSLWPFFVGDVVELPYTLPQDHTLLNVLGRASLALWIDELERIERRHGLVEILAHPDRGYVGDRLGVYEEFLDAVAERSGLWKPLPREIAAWWRRRDAGEGDWATARLDGDGVELVPPQPA